MSISEAVAEIGKMAKFAKAFEGADVVLKELAGYEQNRQELLASISKLKAEQAKLAAEADKAKLDAAGVLGRASDEAASTVASAKAEAEALVAEAREYVSKTTLAGQKEIADLQKKINGLKAAEAALSNSVKETSERLGLLTSDLETTKAHLRKLVS
jgi:chromosome segregation ATPase